MQICFCDWLITLKSTYKCTFLLHTHVKLKLPVDIREHLCPSITEGRMMFPVDFFFEDNALFSTTSQNGALVRALWDQVCGWAHSRLNLLPSPNDGSAPEDGLSGDTNRLPFPEKTWSHDRRKLRKIFGLLRKVYRTSQREVILLFTGAKLSVLLHNTSTFATIRFKFSKQKGFVFVWWKTFLYAEITCAVYNLSSKCYELDCN